MLRNPAKKGPPWTVQVVDSLSEVSPEAWNAISDPQSPFLDYEFLEALEVTGCVGPKTSWHPFYILLYDNQQRKKLLAAAPLYHRYDSYGEYVFDHLWAEAYQQAALSYYPKGLVSAPFTPVTGKRLLLDNTYEPSLLGGALLASLLKEAKGAGLSSVHMLFLREEEIKIVEEAGFLMRLSLQFHWENKPYADFADFLGEVRSGRRKQIKKERGQVAKQGLYAITYAGKEIELEHMRTMFAFYTNTSRRKWAVPYLNWDFFTRIYEKMRSHILLVFAYKEGEDEPVAGCINFIKGDSLAGRYWGAKAYYPALHFELCYYQLIEYAIQKGIKKVEAGAQGEHKFFRGFAPQPCYSGHLFFHPGGQKAIQNFLEKEAEHVNSVIESYRLQSPLKALRHSVSRERKA